MGAVMALWWLVMAPALAETPVERAQQAQLDQLRRQMANQVQLLVYDLIDEVVYGWTQEPVFATPTPVVLAGVSVPLGFGTGLQALVENHVMEVVTDNPSSEIQLVHCPTCTAVVVHSGPEGTVVSRGLDNPAVWDEIGGIANRHALFLDVEAEGTALVLRARLTKLTPDLPIVWSRTVTTAASTPALLRQSDALKSAKDVREEYLNALKGRRILRVPLRIGVRSYALPDDTERVGPPPFYWVQTGVEIGTSQAFDWTASVLVGATWVPTLYQGLMAQARVHRLVTGRARSLTRPDLYLFVGGGLTTVWGPGTGSFTNDPIDAGSIVNQLEGDDPRTTFGMLQVGGDLRFGRRVGISAFFEWLPAFGASPNFGSYLTLGVRFQSAGTEVSFWF